MGKNKPKKKYVNIDLWNPTKRDEVISKDVDINKSDLKQIPVEKQNEHKTLIKDGIKMSENNEKDDSNKKNEGKNSSGLKNAEVETNVDDKKVEIGVPKSSFSEKNDKKSIDNSSYKMKGNHKKLINPASNDNFENIDKARHENILDPTSSDSKNDVKPTHEENNKRNKKKNRGEDKNDPTQLFDKGNEINSEKNNQSEKKETKKNNEFDQQNLSRPNDIKTSYETTKSSAIENKDFHNEKYDSRNRENKNIDKNDYDYNRSEKTPFIQKTKSESLKKIHSGSAITDQNTRASRSTNHNAYTDHTNRTKSASRRDKSHSGISNTNINGINSRHSKNQDTCTDRSSYTNEKHAVDKHHYSQKDQNSDSSNIKYQKGKSNKHRKEDRPIIEDEKSVLVEIDADLFHLSKDTPLAHCVAEDLRMGAGIAVEFKRYFKGVGTLVDQKLTVGDVGIVKRHEQLAFYLVTKKISSGKPTMLSMKMALRSLLQIMKNHNLTKLGIPKIGCGLDGLDWDAVKELITDVFAGSGIHITVCIPSKILDRKPSPSLTVYITPKNLWEMEKQTDIILLIDIDQFNKNNWINDVEAKVNARYPFIENLLSNKSEKMNPGDIKQYCIKNENIICVFTSQTAYYSNLEKAFEKIKKTIKDKEYRYFAFQSGPIRQDENFKHISWTVLILRSIINFSELWLCGDTDQSEDKVIYDQFCKCVFSNSRNYSSSFNSPAQMAYNKPNDGNSNNYHTSSISNKNWKTPKQIFERK